MRHESLCLNVCAKAPQPNLFFLIRGACFWKKKVRNLILQGIGPGCQGLSSFAGQQ